MDIAPTLQALQGLINTVSGQSIGYAGQASALQLVMTTVTSLNDALTTANAQIVQLGGQVVVVTPKP